VENSGVEPPTPVLRAKASEWFHPEGVRGLWTPVPRLENLGNFTAAKVSL